MDQASDDTVTQKRAIADFYSRIAPRYDAVGPVVFARFGEQAVTLAGIQAGDRVLDVATGRGANLFPAAAAVGASGSVVGIDLAEAMVAETAHSVQQRGLTNVSVLVMDAEDLIVADRSFDAVLCSFAYFFFPHLDRALSQFFRVLCPGGKLLLTAHGATDERWRWYEDLLVATFERHNLTWPPTDGKGHRSQEELTALLTQAGFDSVRWEPLEVEAIYADEEEWWAAKWMHGSRRPLEAMPPDILSAFAAEVKSRVARLREPDGLHERWRIVCAVALARLEA